MKNSLLIIGLLFSCLSLVGMESPPTYEGPQETLDKKEIEINARDKDNFPIGWIMYKYLADQKAEITLFEVDEDLQNNKQHRIGQNLFKRLVTDAIAHNCTQISWTVNPVGDLDTRTLCIIYKKIINRLPHSSQYTVTEGDPYGPGYKKIDMTLVLKK